VPHACKGDTRKAGESPLAITRSRGSPPSRRTARRSWGLAASTIPSSSRREPRRRPAARPRSGSQLERRARSSGDRALPCGGRGRTFESCRAHGSTMRFLDVRNPERAGIRPSFSASVRGGRAYESCLLRAGRSEVLGFADRGSRGLGTAQDRIFQDRPVGTVTFIAPVLKTGNGGNLVRGFESHPRRS
jgi:hypothetical protein